MPTEILQSIILGLVQGITEFLPISSSAHLLIFHNFWESSLENSLTFDVFLHFGTLLALIIYFFKDIIQLIKGFFASIFRNNFRKKFEQRLSWFLLVATIPAGLVGYFFGDFIENNLRSIPVAIGALVGVGILFILVERFVKVLRSLEVINLGDSIFIGLAQILALIPGVSRSGITIVAGMSKKLNRGASAKFAFLMGIPIILGAVIKQLSETNISEISLAYFFGLASAFVAGMISIRFLMNFLTKHSLTGFAIYRFVLAAALIVIFIL